MMVNTNTNHTVMLENSSNSTTNQTGMPEDYKISLLVLYTFILFAGTLNVLVMSCMLQSQKRLSFTQVSVVNLIAVHSIFLLTVPFRIYYYASNGRWDLSMFFCKVVSCMIHAHMYLAFIFYVFLLIVRYLEHSDQQHKLEFHRILHAAIASAVVWLAIFSSVFPTMQKYGTAQNDSTQCFHFGQALRDLDVQIINYVICALVILTWTVLAFFQVYFLIKVSKKHGRATCQRHEFWAQLKNLVFLSVMFFCFVPYQGFRVYYVKNYEMPNVNNINEIFLAITAFSCFDMIAFGGRYICKHNISRRCFCCL